MGDEKEGQAMEAKVWGFSCIVEEENGGYKERCLEKGNKRWVEVGQNFQALNFFSSLLVANISCPGVLLYTE